MGDIMDIVEPYTDALNGSDDLFGMTGLRGTKTGLPVYIWVSHNGGAKHDVRIKVSDTHRYNPDGETIIGLRPEFHIIHGEMDRKVETLVRRWAELNMDALIALWDEDIDHEGFEERMVRV